MSDNSYYSQQAFRELDDSHFQCLGIELVPGNHCQLRCEACYKISDRQRRSLHRTLASDKCTSHIPITDVLDYVHQAKRIGFCEAAFLGGEPTLHSGITDIVRGTHNEGLRPILCTNGLNINPPLLQALSDTEAVVVTHANIPGKEQLIDSYSGRDGYAERLRDAIELLKKDERIQLVLEMPLTDSLYPHAFEFFRSCREQGIVPFVEISRSRDNGMPTTSITPEQVQELFLAFQEYDREHFPELMPDTIQPPAYGNSCTMSITGLHIKNFNNGDYGGVYSCCAQPIRHGNLRTQTLEEVFQSTTLAIYQNQNEYIVGPCRDCDLYKICKGGCRGEAVLRFGCPRASSPACHLISPDVRNDPTIMAPTTCEGCPAITSQDCSLTKPPQ